MMHKNLSSVEIKAVAFDMDGLMFNSEDVYFETGIRLLRAFGCEYTHELSSRLMGCTPRQSFEMMIAWHDLTVTWQELQRESNRIFLSIVREWLRPMPGLFDLLDFLEERKIPRAICTSSCLELVEAMLPIYDLRKHFDFVITSENVTHGKPNPEIYLQAAERFGVAPASMMVLEDSHNGCLAGARAGAFVVAVPGDHSREQDFSMAGCTIATLDDPVIFEVLASK